MGVGSLWRPRIYQIRLLWGVCFNDVQGGQVSPLVFKEEGKLSWDGSKKWEVRSPAIFSLPWDGSEKWEVRSPELLSLSWAGWARSEKISGDLTSHFLLPPHGSEKIAGDLTSHFLLPHRVCKQSPHRAYLCGGQVSPRRIRRSSIAL